MAGKKLLTIFGSTGNQGGNIIDVVLSNPRLTDKYALRGITRSKSSAKAQRLSAKGVDMVEADLNDSVSVQAALKDSYGVFAMTDYWSLLDKEKEIRFGKDIFEACKKAGVEHLVWSSLPYVSRLSEEKFTGVAHFDSKAMVEEYIEANKGAMTVSYFLPAMFMDVVKQLVQVDQDKASLSLPFPDPNIPWPLLSPSRDTGKYVVGLFEGGADANGVKIQGVSEWVTPQNAMATVEEVIHKSSVFTPLDPATYANSLPEQVREDMSQMMQWIGDSSYYGKGSQEDQAESGKWLADGSKLTTWKEFVQLELS